MISSHEPNEEVSLVVAKWKEVRNDNPRSWIDDIKTFLIRNGYPQGLGKGKIR